MHVSLSPIGPWPVVVIVAVLVTVLTIWAYQQRLRGTSGRWRWFALGLRLAAVLLCVLAALRPSIVMQAKKKQPTSVIFLLDDSGSMKLRDEAGGKSRWDNARETWNHGRSVAQGLGPNIEVKSYSFSKIIKERTPEDESEPVGQSTAIGAALQEAVKRQAGMGVAMVVLLSDGSNNEGLSPTVEARRLGGQQIKVATVGFGSPNAGPASRDISIRDLVAGPTVFVKNQLQVKGSLVVRGFPNQSIEVEMYADDQKVATTTLKAPEGTEVVPITGLKYIPATPGEKKITLKVKPRDGELIQGNNEVGTFISVLSGGLNVLFVQGPNAGWEHKYFMRAVKASPDIQGDSVILRAPSSESNTNLSDADFASNKYNVYVLSDLPAKFLTQTQQQLLSRAVEKGAGLIMLGGRSSFGPGGWADTSLASVLPVSIHPGDGQTDPEGGVKFVPNLNGPANFLFQVGADRAETVKIWQSLPPLSGTNQFGSPKLGAFVLAQSPGRPGEPLMIGNDIGKGRSLAFGGETWVWSRSSEMGLKAHRKFWRQIIFWLAHKEDQGDNRINVALDKRRLAVGEKLDLKITARDAKGAPLDNVEIKTRITREGSNSAPEPVPIFNEGDDWRGNYLALGQPGEFKVTVTATRNNQEIGQDTARFLVYQDDREMENPAADLALLRDIATTTGGQFLAPEKLDDYLKSLSGKIYSEYVSQTEHKIWDNWPFFLIFTALLTLEWFLRKRHGWV
ncbi:glutamine amidotransferase [Singulisphaera sp. PoT]|uniref:glutamine amidotransferase n=1 Tax=Singulisphaera sp. PoT TaxID=3411797 RepID=UPI003BF5385F